MRPLIFAILLLVTIFIPMVSCTGGAGSSERAEGVDVVTAMTAQYRKISPQLAKEMMDSGDTITVVDVRTPSEYAAGHIEGALLIPNETITTADKPAQLPDLDDTILVYCRSGNRSSQAARKLVSLGYMNVYDFGGINDWPYEIVR